MILGAVVLRGFTSGPFDILPSEQYFFSLLPLVRKDWRGFFIRGECK